MFRSSGRKLKILVLFVRYGETKYTDALQSLRAFYDRFSADVKMELAIVDNSLVFQEDRILENGARLLNGDNNCGEFTAWDKALATYGQRLSEFDLVHFATSAFNAHYNGYLNYFEAKQFEVLKNGPICLGHIDSYPEEIELDGYPSQSWIRTCFFFMSPSRLALLGNRTTSYNHLDAERFFSGNPEFPFAPQAPLNLKYRQYLMDWLTGPGLGHGAWHSQFKLDITTMAFFRHKALAIINEHGLTIRMRSLGIRTLDVAWLRHVLGSDVRLNSSWAEQVQIRTRILSGELKLNS